MSKNLFGRDFSKIVLRGRIQGKNKNFYPVASEEAISTTLQSKFAGLVIEATMEDEDIARFDLWIESGFDEKHKFSERKFLRTFMFDLDPKTGIVSLNEDEDWIPPNADDNFTD